MDILIRKLEEARDRIRTGDIHALDSINEAYEMAEKIKDRLEQMENIVPGPESFMGIPDGKMINFNGPVEKISIYLDGKEIIEKIDPPRSN